MITRGLYRHYKGDVYFVESVGQSHSNADEGTPRAAVRWVLYQSTQSCATGDGITRMRPESEFEQWVIPDLDGAHSPDGFAPSQYERDTGSAYVFVRGHKFVAVPRFARVGAP